MEERDLRTLTPEAQFEVRRQAVYLFKKEKNFSQIADTLRVNRNSVSSWIATYKAEGMKGLKPRKRGPAIGTNLQLDPEQQAVIRKKIVDHDPEQMKLPFALWTREAVGQLIKEETGKELDLRQVGRYLKRWGFTPQRPVKRAYQRDDKAVTKWLEEEYPAIKKRAKEEGAEIHWADEAGIKSHDHRGRGYAPKGKTPIRLHNPNGEKINKISSITNQGKLRFLCYEGKFNYRTFHRFLKSLIKDAEGQKLHVIVDNLPSHHSRVIKRWARRYSHLIEIHYLPSYCPDLNPDEYLNCDLKTELAKKPERRKKGKLKEIVVDALHELQKTPERIMSYFNAAPIKYAAA